MAAALGKQTIRQHVAQKKPSHFYFFKSPTVIMPSFQITRRLFNPIHRRVYKWRMEPEYSDARFFNGAIQATLLAAINLRERKLDKFREISTEKMTSYMSARLPELPQTLLDQKLNFTRSQIVNGFIHSSFFSMNSIVQFAVTNMEPDSRIYHSTCAFFIDQSAQFSKEMAADDYRLSDGFPPQFPPPNAPSIRKLLERPQDLLVCNLTLSRQVGGRDPEKYGRWRITDMNFFDCQFAFDKMHTY